MEWRAALEMASVPFSGPWLAKLPPGDGHPVLILPGFSSNDRPTALLRRQLRRWGYRVHGWGLGRNVGPTPRIVQGLSARLAQLHARYEGPVSVIGWSLGGIYARELARQEPAMVRDVITLGSPYRMVRGDRSSLSPITDRMSQFDTGEEWGTEDSRPALSMPATSIYSRSDGIVRWHACIDRSGPRRENVEVYASHLGMVYNPGTLFVIADRLAQLPDEWRKFEAPARLRHLIRAGVDWEPQAP